VMAAPTIPVSAEENLGDPIDIRVDIIHPEPVTAVAFLAATVEDLIALRSRVDIAEAMRTFAILAITNSSDVESG
nr:hypothetical protein [Tanacetum cinerariifolium]